MRTEELKDKSRAELLELAKEHEVPNRSRLTKDELIAALRKTGRSTAASAKAAAKPAPKRARARGETEVTRAEAPKAAAPRGARGRSAEVSERSAAVSTGTPASAEAPRVAPTPVAAAPIAPAAPRNEAPMRERVSEPPREEAPRDEARRDEPRRDDHRRHERARPEQGRPEQGRPEQGRPEQRRDEPRRDDSRRGDPHRGNPRRDARGMGHEDEDDDSDPWNSVKLGRDPNYGRFLNDPSALGPSRFQGRGANRGGRGNPQGRPNAMRRPGGPLPPQSESLLDRSERGRNRAVERTHQGRNERGSNRRDDGRRGHGGSQQGHVGYPGQQHGNQQHGAPHHGNPQQGSSQQGSPQQGSPQHGGQGPGREGQRGGEHGRGGRDRHAGRSDQRADRMRDDLRRSGEARRGSGYTPQFGRPGREPGVPYRAGDPTRPQGEALPSERPVGRDPRPMEPRGAAPRNEEWGRRPNGARGRGDVRPGDESRDALRFRSATYAGRPGAGDEPARPVGPGGDQIHVVARDPYWLYAHWEITEATIERVVSELRNEWDGCKGILRVHSFPSGVDGPTDPPGFTDVEVDEDSTSWYIHAGVPNRSFRVDVGVLTPSGTFYPIAASNTVTTPSDRVAPEGGEVWIDLPPPEAAAQIARSAERKAAAESAKATDAEASAAPKGETRPADEMQPDAASAQDDATGQTPEARAGMSAAPTRAPVEWESGVDEVGYQARDEWSDEQVVWRPLPELPRRPDRHASRRGRGDASAETPLSPRVGRTPEAAATARSAAWSPGAGRGEETRTGGPEDRASAFRFTINTELVIYGATEPDARVTIEGKPVALRPDGTFTVRVALPEGMHVLPAIAVSRDGRAGRRISTAVTRRSEVSTEAPLGEGPIPSE
ncbi:MAG: DUF4912 domain-containing protein [Candidatus Eisenbacteria bacterium]